MSTNADITSGVLEEQFPRLDRRSLSRDAADRLRTMIEDGSLKPGDKLPAERVLASRLGVSRPTLREAVRALVVLGMVESRQGSGTFISAAAPDHKSDTTITLDLSEDPLGKLFELRLLLEPPSTARAAARVTKSQLAELSHLVDEAEASVNDAAEFVKVDAEFHRLIHVAGQSALTLTILDAISDLALRGRGLSGAQRGVTARTALEHRVILDALERNDAFEASAAMTAHLMHVRASVIGRTT